MVKSESEIRKSIRSLEIKLQENETRFMSSTDIFLKNRLLMQSFNIESQLYALHFVLGETYKYKHM